MSQVRPADRPHTKPVTNPGIPGAELDDAVMWLSQHFGVPAPSRQVFESRTKPQRR